METDYCQKIVLDLKQHCVTDIHILGLPRKLLVEIGLEIKNKTDIENLFVISLSNDALGYVCRRRAYKQKGYGPGRGTNLAEGAGEIITKQALNITNRMRRSR